MKFVVPYLLLAAAIVACYLATSDDIRYQGRLGSGFMTHQSMVEIHDTSVTELP